MKIFVVISVPHYPEDGEDILYCGPNDEAFRDHIADGDGGSALRLEVWEDGKKIDDKWHAWN